ncbi:MAG: STAS domain-containing protein [Bacteroidia bacterium]|nr:STAS domain-containing protein [Bacteroidia bacterium]
MKFVKQSEERYSVIKLLEEKLDTRISPQLKSEFINLNTIGVKNIVLNLEDVKYVDSSGLSSILTANRICSTAGGILVLCHLNPHVEKLITISHLNNVLNILPTEAESRDAILMAELEREIMDDGGSDEDLD